MSIKKKKKDKAKDLIFYLDVKRLHGEVIGKIASSMHYTFEDKKVDELADALIEEKEIETIGVLDSNMKIKGLLIRTKLFDTLSKPFGRDLYKNKPISSIAEPVESVSFAKNIFSVAEIFDSYINSPDIRYFALLDEKEKFRGIFSTRDILVYLSEITKKDINMAKKLQMSIVKEDATFKNENIEIVAATKMAKGVGGDFYTARKYSDTNWVMALCDVSGKGVAASLISVTLSGMFTIYDFNNGVAPFIKAVNGYITQSFESGKFITGIFVDINEVTGELTIYDMGHSYTYRLKDKRAERIDSPKENLPLGLVETINPIGRTITLNKGELLITVSDGIEEQTNIEGEEYSVSRFLNLLLKNFDKEAPELRAVVFNNIHDFRRGQAQQDDMTFMVLSRK